MKTTRISGVQDLDGVVPGIQTKTAVLGIVGAPGSGKSTIAAALVALDPTARVHVPMDGFHLADQTLIEIGLLANKGTPDTFDAHGYAALLKRVRSSPDHVVYAPTFERDLEQPLAGALPILPTASMVITEGCYLLLDASGWREARQQLEEVWFIEVDPEERRQRLMKRHIRFGKTHAEAEQWVHRVDEQNAALVDMTRASADRIFDCSDWQLN